MPVCFVKNCKNHTGKCLPGVTFHRIPTKYKLEWLSAINQPADTVLSNQRVCSEHFSATDFLSDGERRLLKNGAVPSLRTVQSIDENCMKSESIDRLMDTHSVWLPEQREETVASECSASSENNSIDGAVMLKKDDFLEICRCCLSEPTVANIFNLKYGDIFFVDIIFKLFGTHVNSNDGLPKNICAACVAALINFYNFQQKYNNSLATLLSALREKQVYHIQDDIVNEDIKEEKPDISISENELDEECLNENIKNQEPESTISVDPNIILPKKEELCMENDTENEEFHIIMENSKDELDEEFQHERIKEERSTNTKGSYVSYDCETCGQRFLQNASLQVHDRIHKLSSLVNQIGDENGVSNSIPDSLKEKRTCSCGEIFYTSNDFKQHKKEKNHLDPLDKKCEICNKIVPTRGLVRHMREAHNIEKTADVKLDCSTCGKVFKARKYLTEHLKTHGERNFLCSDCGRRFYYASHFKMHCQGHTGEKPFTCNVCGEKLRTSTTLSKHMSIHTGKKPYVCKFCSKAFRQGPHLQRHLRTHTGEKPHKCPYCDKTFAYYATRSVHIRTHTGKKPYTCDTCGESFSQKSSMKVHHLLCRK